MCKNSSEYCRNAALLARLENISVSNSLELLHVMWLKLIKTKNVNINRTCADATVTYLSVIQDMWYVDKQGELNREILTSIFVLLDDTALWFYVDKKQFKPLKI